MTTYFVTFSSLNISSHNKANGRIANLKTEVTRKQSTPRGRNVRFSENLTWFAFLLPPIWDSPFKLITNETEFLSRASSSENENLIKLWFEKVPSSRIASRLNHQQPLRVEVKPFRVVLSKRK